MNQEKIKELMKDEGFAKELSQAKSYEEATVLLKTKGIDITADELEEMHKNAGKDLSEDELSNVAGGFSHCAAATPTGFYFEKI